MPGVETSGDVIGARLAAESFVREPQRSGLTSPLVDP
jgi:hypothetical protein